MDSLPDKEMQNNHRNNTQITNLPEKPPSDAAKTPTSEKLMWAPLISKL